MKVTRVSERRHRSEGRLKGKRCSTAATVATVAIIRCAGQIRAESREECLGVQSAVDEGEMDS